MGSYYISRFTGQEIDEMLARLAKSIYPSMNCPNCGAPITSGVCEYCGTKHYEPKLDKAFRINTGGNGGTGFCGNGGAGVVWTYENKR